MATIHESLALGIQHHRTGNLPAAEQIYRQILDADPNHAEAVHLLGLLAQQTGQHQVAVQFIRRAIELNGVDSVFHNNLGNALAALGDADGAMASYRRALELKPDYANAWQNLGLALLTAGRADRAVECYQRVLNINALSAEGHRNLGIALRAQGRLNQAIACYRQALALVPDYVEALFSLGDALREAGKPAEAAACFERIIQLQPQNVAAHNDLGIALENQGLLSAAAKSYGQALQLNPQLAAAHNNLGNIQRDLGQLGESMASYRRALEFDPNNANAYSNFGNALADQGKLDQAVACYRRALELKPDFAGAFHNLANSLKAQGRLRDAIASYRRALELNPNAYEAHSDLLLCLHYSPDYDARALYEEHRRWNKQHAEPLPRMTPSPADERSPERRLRIGYVSPDFRTGSIALLLLPLLESHDRKLFEVYCYNSSRFADSVTERCQAQANVWRNVVGLSDEQLAQTIRQDGIDILIDLSLHTGHHRLLTFARKPAPVQLSYLACTSTTGLDAIDYRLTDPYLDPPVSKRAKIYSETSVVLPETYWCYRPLSPTPEAHPLPALQTGRITFGCLNQFFKVTPALPAWVDLLQAMPNSTLLLLAPRGEHRADARKFLAERGVAPERLNFVDPVSHDRYFQLYHEIDVALDSFPYGGGVTTCDALWMGVPVVSLAGQTAVGRAGLSILSNLGLPELVASDREGYIRIARDLAQDLSQLKSLRATLRDRLQASPLMNAPRFTRNIEAAYREMWRRYVAGSLH